MRGPRRNEAQLGAVVSLMTCLPRASTFGRVWTLPLLQERVEPRALARKGLGPVSSALYICVLLSRPAASARAAAIRQLVWCGGASPWTFWAIFNQLARARPFMRHAPAQPTRPIDRCNALDASNPKPRPAIFTRASQAHQSIEET